MDTRTAIKNYLEKHHTGRANAIHCCELERLFGVDRRTIQRNVSKLRKEGFPICSDQNGYFYAENQKEINSTIKRINSQVLHMSNARNGMLYASIVTPIVPELKVTVEVVGGE